MQEACCSGLQENKLAYNSVAITYCQACFISLCLEGIVSGISPIYLKTWKPRSALSGIFCILRFVIAVIRDMGI